MLRVGFEPVTPQQTSGRRPRGHRETALSLAALSGQFKGGKPQNLTVMDYVLLMVNDGRVQGK
jgi:hypothetical protein